MTVSQERINEFIEAGYLAGKHDLFRYSSGNLSCRLDDNKVLLSASGSWLGRLKPEEVVICELETGSYNGEKKPTMESRFHLGILRARRDINVVLHFQSLCATAIACGDPEDVDFNVISEIPAYVGSWAIVEYDQPGSAELAEAVKAAAGENDMVILKNHGLVTVGTDYYDAIRKAGFFELACEILLKNKDARILPQSAVNLLKRMEV